MYLSAAAVTTSCPVNINSHERCRVTRIALYLVCFATTDLTWQIGPRRMAVARQLARHTQIDCAKLRRLRKKGYDYIAAYTV